MRGIGEGEGGLFAASLPSPFGARRGLRTYVCLVPSALSCWLERSDRFRVASLSLQSTRQYRGAKRLFSRHLPKARSSLFPLYMFAPQNLKDPAAVDRLLSRTPLGRLAQPQDVSGIVAFLASPAAAFITGQTIAVDGGYSVMGFW